MGTYRALAFFMFMVIVITSLDAVEVTTQVSVQRPTKGQPFYLIIKVNGVKGSGPPPFVSFDPGRITVQKRSVDKGGQFYAKRGGSKEIVRNFTFKYKLVATTGGRHSIRKIEIEQNGKVYKSRNILLMIRTAPAKPRDIFLATELSATQAVVGEGVNVDYFLYYRQVELGDVDIKKFPKLNNFIKRFHANRGKVERVSYQRVMYRRIPIYSARVYPQKTGRLIVDPLHVRVESRRFGSHLGAASSSRSYAKTLLSQRVYLEVESPSLSGVPKNFSGLIGHHQGRITLDVQSVRVGDMVELTLTVGGEGNLERFDAPKLYNTKSLESFDTKAEFKEIGLTQAEKRFYYTYLARDSENIPAKAIKISYFLPATREYKTLAIMLPALNITASNGINKTPPTSKSTKPKRKSAPLAIKQRGLVAPVFSTEQEGNLLVSWWGIINVILLGIIVWQLIVVVRNKRLNRVHSAQMHELLKRAKEGEVSYSLIYQLLSHLTYSSNVEDYSLLQIVEISNLSDAAKEYFVSTIPALEEQEFHGREDQQMVLESRFYKELIHKVDSMTEVASEITVQ
jgi:hypothetical protein